MRSSRINPMQAVRHWNWTSLLDYVNSSSTATPMHVLGSDSDWECESPWTCGMIGLFMRQRSGLRHCLTSEAAKYSQSLMYDIALPSINDQFWHRIRQQSFSFHINIIIVCDRDGYTTFLSPVLAFLPYPSQIYTKYSRKCFPNVPFVLGLACTGTSIDFLNCIFRPEKYLWHQFNFKYLL